VSLNQRTLYQGRMVKFGSVLNRKVSSNIIRGLKDMDHCIPKNITVFSRNHYHTCYKVKWRLFDSIANKCPDTNLLDDEAASDKVKQMFVFHLIFQKCGWLDIYYVFHKSRFCNIPHCRKWQWIITNSSTHFKNQYMLNQYMYIIFCHTLYKCNSSDRETKCST
jgi:hypothetical protein